MKTTKKENAINFLMTKKNALKEVFESMTMIHYYLDDDTPVVAIFFKSFKPYYHVKFKNDDDVLLFITKQKQQESDRVIQSNLWLKNKEKENEQIQTGSILYSSWGYEQTNIDFYEVIERKNRTILMQEIGQKRTFAIINGSAYNDRGSCVPDNTHKKGEPFKKLISKRGYINLASYKGCYLYDGIPKSWSSYA
jgi:hypothetical protein